MLEASDPETLEQMTWDLPYTRGVTHTADGLRHGRHVMEQTARGDVKVRQKQNNSSSEICKIHYTMVLNVIHKNRIISMEC
jgi:hypothetical protein